MRNWDDEIHRTCCTHLKYITEICLVNIVYDIANLTNQSQEEANYGLVVANQYEDVAIDYCKDDSIVGGFFVT